jgi:hypothetical protein
VCYSFDDPFDERSYCIPDTVCGGPRDAGELQRWELDSEATAAKLRAKYEAKRALHSGKIAPIAEPADPDTGE